MTQCVVAAAAAGELLCSEVIPPLPGSCKGCPWPGHLQTSSLELPQPPAVVGSSSPWTSRAPVFPAEAAHSQREERSQRWGCPGFLSPLPGMLLAAAVSSSSCPAFARCNPKLGINSGPAQRLPSPESFPPTRTEVASIHLAHGCLGFVLFGRNVVLCRVQLERVSAAIHWAGGGWLPGFPGDTQPSGDRGESLPFSSGLPFSSRLHP